MCDGDVGTMACPSCPDGNEWGVDGPTGRECRTCGGHAAVHLDGSRIDGKPRRGKPEEYEPERRERLLDWDRGVGP